ncbi:TonB-dependent receptor [Tamlana agarivorans]|uniref:TonB-dependent receptor n=1 Tax=Pseudotamlana agarivorans TaxID=481183 RepID=A0ACC5U9F3_9FLAO|nr:TonB-dependent receptor [Tamlana agarivorans]MBU2950936.1 TonB-dependent receptor [Tamlana agarivorans]
MKKILSIFLVMASLSLFAQQKEVTGKVTNKDGVPMPGASVIVKGSKRGAMTDFDGEYSISAQTGEVLSYSYIGMEDKEVTVGAASVINVALNDSNEELEEIVVVGYGTVKKSDLTGSVSQVKGEELTKIGAISFDQALAGRAAGVVVQQSSGQPGGGANVRIRGISSLSGSDPLYVIDGVPLENNSSSGLGDQDQASASLSPLSMINPEDIESIEILKDASSTAIYGSRGANGVVLITTKQGKIGKGVITIQTDYGLTEVPSYIDVLDSNNFVRLQMEAKVNGGGTLEPENITQLDSARAGLLPTTKWQESVLGLGTRSNTNLSFSGGTEAMNYLISSNLFDSEGVIPETNFNRVSTRINLNAKVKEKLKVGVNVNYAHITSDQRAVNTGVNELKGASNAIRRALRAAPTNGLDADDEDLDPNTFTPLTALEANNYENVLTQIQGNVYLEYDIIDGLKFRTQLGYQNRNTTQRYYQLNTLGFGLEGGTARTGDGRHLSTSMTNTLNFNKKYGKLHAFNAVLGQSLESYESETVRVSNYGFANDLLTYYTPGLATFYDPDIVQYTNNKLASFFGRVNYTLNRKYLFTVTGRYDGASKFASNKKWAFFPAAAFGYKLSEENFMKDSNVISNMKLRVSYGTSGNQAIQPYQSLDQYGSGILPFGEQPTAVYYQQQLPNPDLTWETTTQFDVGLDYGLLHNKISGSFEYYEKLTDDLLFSGNRIPVQSGFENYTKNFGTLLTKGFEASITANIVATEDFSWTLNANFSTGKTTIQDMASNYVFSGWDPGYISGGSQRLIIGEEVGTFWGYKTQNIAQFDDFVEFQGLTEEERVNKYKANPAATYTFVNGFKGGVPENGTQNRPGEQLYEDINDDGELSEDDRQIIGQAQPDYMFGINNSFTIGNIDISIFIDSQLNKDVANIPNLELLSFNGSQSITDAIGRWTPENQNNEWPRMDASNDRRAPFSDMVIEDGSFVRIQNLTIGYSLPNTVLEKIKFKGFRVYVSGSNLAVWTKYTGLGPDVSLAGSNATSMGHDNAAYPVGRVITLGANIKF